MERLAGDQSLPFSQQIELRFALGSAYEAAERYDDAFQQLEMGNALKRSSIRYDESGTLRILGQLERYFTQLLATPDLRGCGFPSARPIFIFGMPRAGTTLVEQLLSSHPSVAAGGELRLFEELFGELTASLAGAGSPMTRQDICAKISSVGERYVTKTSPLAGDAVRLTDKQPHNFVFAPMIHLTLPKARMIHVKRDWLDTCFSCYATLFDGDSITYAYDLRELARYYRSYQRMMAVWRTQIPQTHLLEIDYESLVENFEAEARRIVAFCDLPWDARVLDFHLARRPVRTASRAQVRRPLYRGSVGRGRRFARHLQPVVDVLSVL